MKTIFLAALTPFFILGCGSEPKVEVKNEANRQAPIVKAEPNLNERDFTGSLADDAIRYHLELIDRGSEGVFLELQVFDTDSQENLELDALPQVTHRDTSGCCDPKDPTVTEISENTSLLIGALDFRHPGKQYVSFRLLIDNSTYEVVYEFEHLQE